MPLQNELANRTFYADGRLVIDCGGRAFTLCSRFDVDHVVWDASHGDDDANCQSSRWSNSIKRENVARFGRSCFRLGALGTSLLMMAE